MTFDNEVEKTEVLKTLPRMIGSGGRNDYFVIHTDDKLKVGIKLEIGSGSKVFVRTRIMKADTVDIYNIREHMKLIVGKEKIKVGLSKKAVNAGMWISDATRASWIIRSSRSIDEYGQIDTCDAYEETMLNFLSDLAAIGFRVYGALAPFIKRSPTLRKEIVAAISDFSKIYHPPEPKGYAKFKKGAVPGKAKAKAEVIDIIKGKGKAAKKKDKPTKK